MTPDLAAKQRRNAEMICRFLSGAAIVCAGGGTLAGYHAATTLAGYVSVQAFFGVETATAPGLVMDRRFTHASSSNRGRTSTSYAYYVRFGFRPGVPPDAGRLFNERQVDEPTYQRYAPAAPVTIRYVARNPQVSDIVDNRSSDWVLYALLAGLGVGLWAAAGLLYWLTVAIRRVTNRTAVVQPDRPAGLPPKP